MKKTPAQIHKEHVEYFSDCISKNPVSYNAIIKRIKMGWTNDMIIKTPRNEERVAKKFNHNTSLQPKNQKVKTTIELYREHLDYIKAYNTTIHGTVKPVSRAVFYERIKSGWSEYKAVHTPRKENNVHYTRKPKTITNPVEGVEMNKIASYYKRHIAHIELINKEFGEDIKPADKKIFYDSIKKQSSFIAITTYDRVYVIPTKSYETDKIITNPVKGEILVVDRNTHSKILDLIVTVMIILGIVYYFKEQIQDYIALLLS